MRTKLAMALVLAFAGVAVAQPAGQGSDHGYAPPSDDPPPTPVETTAAGTGDTTAPDYKPVDSTPAVGEGDPGAGHDPTKEFNYAHDFWSYHGKDEYGGKLGDGKMVDPETGKVVMEIGEDGKPRPAEEEPMSPPFIFMVLNFLLLAGLLVWKGGPLANQLSAERSDEIKTALDEAAKLRKQAADKLAEYETRLKDADTEIKNMVAGMKKDAEADKARILETAERQAQQMKKDAEARIAAEIEMARAQLTREVTAAAAAATEKLLTEKMVPADQQKLVGSFITNLQERA